MEVVQEVSSCFTSPLGILNPITLREFATALLQILNVVKWPDPSDVHSMIQSWFNM